MKVPCYLSACTLSCIALLAACQGRDGTPAADLVLTNAYVYTADVDRTIAEAVAIRGDSIVYVGSAEGADDYLGEETTLRDMQGAMLMPGLRKRNLPPVSSGSACEPESRPRYKVFS